MFSVCWLLFVILWYGFLEKVIIFVIVIGFIFFIIFVVELGIKNVNLFYIKVVKIMGVIGLRFYLNVIFFVSFLFVILGMK